MTRPALAAALIYSVLSLVMVAHALPPGRTLSSSDSLWSVTPWSTSKPATVPGGGSNPDLNDTVIQFQPYLLYTRSVFPDVPLWNPFIGSGRPFLANDQASVLSPFSLPAYVFPFWRSLALIAALKLLVAAFGTYLLGRALGMRFGGALLAGVAYAFGLYFVFWLLWPLSSVWAWLPWLWLMADAVVRNPGPLPSSGLAVLVAFQYFGGHPESNFHVLLSTAVFFVVRVVQARPSPRSLVAPALTFGLAVVAGTGLAALQLAPLLELLAQSDEPAQRERFQAIAGGLHQSFRTLLTIFFPDYPLDPFREEFTYYAGALSLMLAAAALVMRRSWTRFSLLALAAFAVIMMVGLAPIFDLVWRLPGFDTSKSWRLAIVLLLCTALLAGWGVDELSDRRIEPRKRRLVSVILGALFCLPLIWVLLRGGFAGAQLGHALEVASGLANERGYAPSSAAPTIRLAAVLAWVVLAGAGLALVALRLSGRIAGPTFIALAVALVVVDLFRAGFGFNPSLRTDAAIQPATGAIRYLESRRPNRFVGVASTDLNAGGDYDPLPVNISMRLGLFDARTYDYITERRYDRIWRENVFQTPLGVGPPTRSPVTPRSLRVLELLSVKDLLVGPNDPRPPVPGLSLAYSGPDATVYADDNALPRVFVVNRQRVVSTEDAALAAVTAPRFDGRRVAITERAIPELAEVGGSDRLAPAQGRARITSYGPEQVKVTAKTSGPGLLVLTDNWFPGWKVTVDGRPTKLHRVDYLLRGVPLRDGSHSVVFTYEPVSWRVGWIIALTTALALLASVLLGRRTGDLLGKRAGRRLARDGSA